MTILGYIVAAVAAAVFVCGHVAWRRRLRRIDRMLRESAERHERSDAHLLTAIVERVNVEADVIDRRLTQLGFPSGCLACNHDAVVKALEEHGVDPERFAQSPPTRHRWSEVTPACSDCGAVFAIESKSDDGASS